MFVCYKLVVDIRRESTERPETNRCEPILRILWSVLILDERKEGWGDVKRRFGAVEPLMFACVYRSHLWSFTMARKPCFRYLTSLFDACCEGGGFEKILLLRF